MMMKKTYQIPQIKVVTIPQRVNLLTGSEVKGYDGNVLNGKPRGGNGTARSRGFNGFDDEEDFDED
jgi:hypothetical protein